MVAQIRWLKRPTRIKRYYSCDKCNVTHSNYIAPDMIVEGPLHLCRYKTPKGTAMKTWRSLTLDP